MKDIFGQSLLTQKDIEQAKWKTIFWPGAAEAFLRYGNI
jgi:hypothetical protein